MSESAILHTRALSKRFGGLQAADEVSITVAAGQIHALIGPNGAGKSTLIGLLSGEILPDHGQVFVDGVDVSRMPVERRARLGLGRSYQITQLCRDFTALENVMLAASSADGAGFGAWRPFRLASTSQESAMQALATVGLSALAKFPVAALAHGQQRQLELAVALALQPKILLLDEPLAGMSSGESEQMIALLLSLKARFPILLVEHDMDAVFRLADHVSVLVYGKIIASASPAQIRTNDLVRRAYLGDEAIVS